MKFPLLRFVGITAAIVSLFLIAGLSEQAKGDHAEGGPYSVSTGATVVGPGGMLGNVSGYAWSSNIGWIKFREHGPLAASSMAKPNTLASRGWAEDEYLDAVSGLNIPFLFLTDERYLYKYDNTDPANPVLVATFDFGAGADARELVVQEFSIGGVTYNRAFVALKGENSISVLDINDASGNIVELVRTRDDVNFLNIEQLAVPSQPDVVFSFSDLVAYIPLGEAGTGFTVVELEYDGVVFLNSVATPWGVSRIYVNQCYVFLAGIGQFSVRDRCANNTDPVEIGTLTHASLGRSYGMAINANYVFITMYEEDRICAIDFGSKADGSPPASVTPQLLQCHDDSVDLAEVGGIQIRDGFLYVTPVPWAAADGYVTVVDFGNFDEVSVVENVVFAGSQKGMSNPLLSEDYLYAASETGVHILNIPYHYTGSVQRAVPGDSSEGRFRGSAWSSAIGWISYEGGETGDPPDGNQKKRLDLTEDATACGGRQYDVCGWMRALAACYHDQWDTNKCLSTGPGDKAGGWDGWIKMRGTDEGVLHTKDQNLADAKASFLGEHASDFSGGSVSSAGDVDGDGFDDFLIGASQNDDGGGAAGKTYLILGDSGGWAPDTDIAAAADASFLGENPNDWSGTSISNAGDVDGDGFDDFLIGASENDDGGGAAGKTYLILGRETSAWNLNESLGGSVAAASFVGEFAGDLSGDSISGAGDVDGDGFDDFLIGASENDDGGGAAGKTYLILGRETSAWNLNESLGGSVAAASFVGEFAGDLSGDSISGAGDVDGDGFDDFLIGAWFNDDGGGAAGKTYLILGRETSAWTLDESLGGSVAAASFVGEGGVEFSGDSVSGAGDVDGDGFDDFLIGASGNDDGGSNAGKTYLILGRETSAWTLDESLGGSVAAASFVGEFASDNSGDPVSGAGDVNNDGFDDFLIGASGNDDGGSNAGKTYLILGKSGGWTLGVDIQTAADASFLGENANDFSGSAVFNAGDVDGDGFDDFLIGASRYDDGADSDAGKTYLTFSNEISYGVSWDPPTKELSGWAWGDDVVGWISFNHLDCDADGDGFSDGAPGCPPSGTSIPEYQVKVYIPVAPPNSPPTVANLSVTTGDYCTAPSPPFTLLWDLDPGDTQSARQVQVDDNSDFSSPEFDTGKEITSSTLWAPPGLAYGIEYYWRVRVWDSNDVPSDWAEYNPLSFTTEAHPYPDPRNFTWSPPTLFAGQPAQFYDDDEGAGGDSFDGDPFDPAVSPADASWEWDFEDDGTVDSTAEDPAHTYAADGSYWVRLTVTDDIGFCSDTEMIDTLLPFPGWIEISPF